VPERSISVRLQALVGGYVQGLQKAKAATSDLINELSKSEEQRSNFQQLGTGLAVAGGAIAAGLGLATKAAIDWETAWAGVVKTVDGSEEQLAALEADLRSMTAELPASHAEIAAVAEAAGQLGIAVDDVADFTRTMIDMGEATNLSAQDAAIAIAQMASVMGTSVDDVDRLGAAVVGLGNNSATTERDIVEMAQRIAGAGATIGLTEADVLGFSAALASVGIEAEAGGSAISRAMIQIETRVRSGGTELEALARVAGMTADEFAQAYQRDAAQAIAAFIEGLGRMQARGEDVFATLEELEFTEIRLRDALLRLASSGDLLNRSLELSSRSWEENTALTEEAERRYQTAAARLEMARNQLNDFAIEMGATFLPAVAEGADAVASFVGWIADLPDPILNTVGVAAALVAGLLLLSGTLMVGVTRIAAYKAAVDQLAASGGMLGTAVGRINRGLQRSVALVGKAAGAFALFELALYGIGAVLGSDLNPQLDAFANGLQRFAREGELSGEAARILGEDMSSLDESLKTLGTGGPHGSVARFIGTVLDPAIKNMEGSMSRSKETVQALDSALRDLVEAGSAREAAEIWDVIVERAERAGVDIEKLRDLFPEYHAALELAADGTGEAAGEIEGLGNEADTAAGKIDALKDAFDRLFGIQMSVDQATVNYHQSMADLVAELEEGELRLDAQTQAGRDNRQAVLDQIRAIADLRQANIDAGMSVEEANDLYKEQIRDLKDLLIQMGLDEAQVHELISAYENIPAQVETEVRLHGAESAIDRVRRLRNELSALGVTDVRIGFPGGVGGGGGFLERHGGITIPAQRGLLRRAAIFTPAAPARFAFAEPATGGEAFIPRIGDRQRSLAIADEAARWHGGRVVAEDQLGGRFQWRGTRLVTPPAGTTTGDGAPEVRVFIGDRELTDIVKVEIRSHDRQLRRAVTAGSGGML